ncbi:site-2 protease family protein [candidate division WOR-3 bacterium]|nr:site-2 protease family protein [candidate division WOR-3 bacterium]
MKGIAIIFQLAILFFSIIIHEVAHGYMALHKGDTTARDYGRLTLNPLPHIDIFGTIILPFLLIFTGSHFLFGWAKPVPINPYYFKDPKKDLMWVGAAGPLSNIGLAIILAIPFRFGLSSFSILGQFVGFGVFINLLLAFFNLIPIPPLDGSRIIQGFLSYETQEKYLRLERFGFLIIIPLLFVLFPLVIRPLVQIFFHLLTGIPSRF